MSNCRFYDKGKCTFTLGCGYEKQGMCDKFRRFDIMYRDEKAMEKAIKEIQEMINAIHVDME